VDDLVDGKWVWYYPSGKLRETSEYKMGMRDGKLTMYDEDGKVISESMFENGIEVKSD
jgi:antitoxin component YwqK of YwqJK toxin-antitoxin module